MENVYKAFYVGKSSSTDGGESYLPCSGLRGYSCLKPFFGAHLVLTARYTFLLAHNSRTVFSSDRWMCCSWLPHLWMYNRHTYTRRTLWPKCRAGSHVKELPSWHWNHLKHHWATLILVLICLLTALWLFVVWRRQTSLIPCSCWLRDAPSSASGDDLYHLWSIYQSNSIQDCFNPSVFAQWH